MKNPMPWLPRREAMERSALEGWVPPGGMVVDDHIALGEMRREDGHGLLVPARARR